MNLWAISDLHLGYETNRQALEMLRSHRSDWLILGGDIGETPAQLEACIQELRPKFAQLIWVPGNHELYTLPKDPCSLRGEARYDHLVERCRHYGVLTPEDPYPTWPGLGPKTTIVPTFLLYDYSFSPEGMEPSDALAWAREAGIVATDERYLHPDPYPSRQAWCAARVETTVRRIQAEIPQDHQIVLINHFPIHQRLVRLHKIPRFSPWCGTRATEDWPRQFPISVVVYGHLHMRATDWIEGIRHEEVALGYPRHWRQESGINHYLRKILPDPHDSSPQNAGPVWHR